MQGDGEINMEAIPMPASISMSPPPGSLSLLEQEEDNNEEMTSAELDQLQPLSMDEPLLRPSHTRRTGRPANPVWQYFLRGAKRNRFHYHAYCRYCVLHYKQSHPDVDDDGAMEHIDSTRGVSSDMIKHLKQCEHTPSSIVEDLEAYMAECHQRAKSTPTPAKRKQPSRPNQESPDALLWKATVSASLPLHWTRAPLIASLLSMPSSLGDIATVASSLAKAQLDKVKEGMLNSTIKGGLTLSVNAWQPQASVPHLVSFSLINSDGDACALSLVSVHDWTVPELQAHVSACLSALRQSNVSIVAIVADAMLPLQAAMRFQAASAPDLLVLPCLHHVLELLLGSLLTDERYEALLGAMMEVTSYLRHPSIPFVPPPVALANDVHSIVATLDAFVQLRDALADVALPPSLRAYLDDVATWTGLRSLLERLRPLHAAMTRKCPTLAHVVHTLAWLYKHFDDDDAMRELLESFWRWYDLPTMGLACVFNVHLELHLSPAVRSLVPTYFEHVYGRWFHAPIPASTIDDVLAAVDAKSFPFDGDVTRDYLDDVSSFYSFVANSHPELCALCCRLFAVAVHAAPVPRLLRRAPMDNTDGLLPWLHIAFAVSGAKTSPPVVAKSKDATRWLHAQETQTHGVFSKREWTALASAWRTRLADEVAIASAPTTQVPSVRLRDFLVVLPPEHLVVPDPSREST
ncbi:hypothetical protein SDRG_07709 [Saprolegnia diclina VS20]|uniref:BED-type domain-containing protein n=1 Tax=Saprolegnia diclina (strain VS20) TaxID=1156394 RepID=T0QM88_SAPDV|nr:hypothetical protein SDRG_07709 [Saprolegnia diclina VS20]EQC34910.1 hypothetical protein SDRG_07709 [Saprolegnia diclina VS20]|eukprot:XP_008611782.1 hypothetical protein SDRG_07709 [Saprolegnia diclina VS20]